MSKAKKQDKETHQPPTPPRWKGSDSLELGYQINQSFFEIMSDLARSADVAGWPLIALDRNLWGRLDAAAIARAARFPFLILDVNFLNEAWWREVIAGAALAGDRQPQPAGLSQELMNETLIFAWHTAKWDRRVARLSVGMLPAVAELIAALMPQQLARISAQHSGGLRLRWADDKDFWTRLLVAARDGDGEALADIHLHANLLLAGALL